MTFIIFYFLMSMMVVIFAKTVFAIIFLYINIHVLLTGQKFPFQFADIFWGWACLFSNSGIKINELPNIKLEIQKFWTLDRRMTKCPLKYLPIPLHKFYDFRSRNCRGGRHLIKSMHALFNLYIGLPRGPLTKEQLGLVPTQRCTQCLTIDGNPH